MTDNLSLKPARFSNAKLAVCGLLLVAEVVGTGIFMSWFDPAVHNYFRKIPGGYLYVDKYFERLLFPIVATRMYAGMFLGLAMIALSVYRSIRRPRRT